MKRSRSGLTANGPDTSRLPPVALFLGLRIDDESQAENATDREKSPPELPSDNASQSLLSSANSTPQKSLPTMRSVDFEDSPPFSDRFVLKSDGLPLQIWALIRDVCLFYSLITTSYYLAFEFPGKGLLVVDIIVWVIFVIDIFVNFLQPYENEDGETVTCFSKIALNYIQTFFFLDVLAIIPLQFANKAEIEYYFRMVRLLKAKQTLDLIDGQGLGSVIPFLLRLSLGKEFKIGLRHKHKAMILHILLYLSFATYTVGCIWFWYSEKTKDAYTRYLLSVHCFRDRFPPDTSSWQLMQRSWYFVITTFASTGYGDLAASNFYETLLLIFLIVAGVSSYSMIIGEFNVIVGELNSFDSRLSDFHLWLKEVEAVQGKIEPGLKWKVIRAYTQFDSLDRLGSLMARWWEASSVDEMTSPADPYLCNLPEATLRQIKDYLFNDVFAIHKDFLGEAEFKYDLCLNFHPRRFESGEIILGEGEESKEVLLVTEGKVSIGVNIANQFSHVITMANRTVIGDYFALVSKEVFATFKAVGAKAILAWGIPNTVFLKVANKHRTYAKEILIRANIRTKFLKKAIEVHLQHMKVRPKPVEGVNRDHCIRPQREYRTSVFESFVTKEEEFVIITQRQLLEQMHGQAMNPYFADSLEHQWLTALHQTCRALHLASGKRYSAK